MQVASETPFSPFAAHASDQQAPFFTLSRPANCLRAPFFTLSWPANSLQGPFFILSRPANSLRGPFSIVSRSANCQRGPFFTLSRCANPEQRSPLPPCTSCKAIAGAFSLIHQRYLPLETSFFLLFFTPTIAIPYPLSRENHPKIQKKPPFCSSLAILTAKISPFPQLERKEGWQLRRCPEGKNKKAALKKGESYISLGGQSGFMLVDWKGAPPAKIKTTARSPALPLIRRE